ncbi:hypothetical protein [Catenovulum sediminis]|uniref:Replication protein n=1 Tax=Catenovulum sediminis TaxID=1740262 RepID=A0ABV1RLG1_9ALTE|nr:hypothetical protein [Catenovulum sediminis]
MDKSDIENDELAEIKESRQLSLFKLLDEAELTNSNKHLEYTNSIGSIDIIPRFWRGKNSAFSKDEATKRAITCTNTYTFSNRKFKAVISPAILTRTNDKGQEEEYFAYPGDREELIEKVLFLIATKDGLHSIRNGNQVRYGVFFSLYRVREELKKINKTRSYDAIKESLMILKDSRIKITSENSDGVEYTITHDIFSDAVLESSGVGRGKNRYWIGFSDYLVGEILKLNYRQVLYSRFTNYSSALSRFLDLYLSNAWKNATYNTTTRISLNRIMENFGKKQVQLDSKRRDMRQALLDLEKAGVIQNVPYAEKTIDDEGCDDYVYDLLPTKKFVDEIIKANAKHKGLRKLSEGIEQNTITHIGTKKQRLTSI